MINANDVVYEHKIFYDDTKELVYYFTAPKRYLKEILGKDYPEAIFTTICVDTVGLFPDTENTFISISPAKEEEGCFVDYDWHDVDLSKDDLQLLVNKVISHECLNGRNSYERLFYEI